MAHEGREPLLKRIWHGLARILCTGIVCPLYRVRAYGMKNVPCKGPLLILCSHQSFLDPIFAQSWVSRNFHFVARESLWESKVMAALLNPLFVVPIKQGAGDISAMRRIIAKLKAGCAVCLFPEGSRTWDGTVQEVKPGFGLISPNPGLTSCTVPSHVREPSGKRHTAQPAFSLAIIRRIALMSPAPCLIGTTKSGFSSAAITFDSQSDSRATK